MGRHSLLLLTLGFLCSVHCLRDVSRRHQTKNPTTAEQLTQIAERFGAANVDELGTSEESSEAPIPSRKVKRLASAEDESDLDVYQGVMGRPGVDFPILPRIPRTTFNCRSVPGPGYYADMDTDCQVFHICDGGRKISFLCPNGTIFRQSHLICDWWWTVDCGSSQEHYEASAEATSTSAGGSRAAESDGDQSAPASRSRPRQRPHDSEQQYYPTQRRQQQQRGSGQSARNIAPSSPTPITSESREADQRRRDQNSYSKQTEVEKQSKSYRSTTYTPPNALREGRNIYNNFAPNTTSVRDRERQQPAETASFVNSRRNNGSRQYEIIQRNNVPSGAANKDRTPLPEELGPSAGQDARLQTSTASSAQQNAFTYSRKVQPALSERRGGRQPSVRWSNGEFQTIRTTVDLPPTSRQGQRSFEDGGGIFVTESSVRNSKYQGTSKQYVELDRSKTFDSKPGDVPQPPTERTVTPIVVRIANPSTVRWQFTTIAPEDLPITDIYRPTGTPFTLEDERGGQNFYTTPRTKVAAEDYVTINRKAGTTRQTSFPVSDAVSVMNSAEAQADSTKGYVAAEDNTEPISNDPITDVNPPKELWFTHEDLAFMSTTPSDDFDSTHITPQPDALSTPTPTEGSFDDEKLIDRSETGHTAAVYVSSSNDQSVATIVNCSGPSHATRNEPSGATLSAGSGREINEPIDGQATGRIAFNEYSTSESVTEGLEFSQPTQSTERTFRKETISHMKASSSDLSLSVTENKKVFYEKELTSDSPFDKEVSPSLWNEKRTLSSAAKTFESDIPEQPHQSSQSFDTDYTSSGKSFDSNEKFPDTKEIESKTTSLPGVQKAVSRGILAPLPVSDTTGKEYQPQGNDLQYDVTTPHNNKEEIFDSSESSHARVTEVFTVGQVATVSTLAEENRETKFEDPITPMYDADSTESPQLHKSDIYNTNTAIGNGSTADALPPTTENPPQMQSSLPEPFINSEVLGTFAAATSRYESRNVKEVPHPPPAKDATQETTEKSTNASTTVESLTSFRRRIYHGKSSSADPVVTTSAPATSPRSSRLASSRKSAIFVEGPRRRLTTTTTTPSVIQRVLSLRQKTTPLTIPLRSAAAAKSVTPKTTHISEQLSKSLLPPKLQDRSEVKSLRRGSSLPKSRTGIEGRGNKTRPNIPPANRPDTLNSLAVYFGLPETEMDESDVSNRIAKMMNDLVGESVNNVNSSAKEIPVQLPPLLTQLTRDSYSALFSLTRQMADMDEVLGYDGNNNNVNYTDNIREGKALYLNETPSGIESLLAKNLSVPLDTSNGLAKEDVRGLRELAQIFSRALTAYLKDPTDFRRILSQARPTEPANNSFETDMTTPLYETTTVSLIDSLKPIAKDDDEVLDFSDVNKAPTLRMLNPTVAPLFDSLVHAATLSKPNMTGSEESNSATTSSKSEYTATESVSFEAGQTVTDSLEAVYESLHDQETNYNFLTTRDPLVKQQTTAVDSTNSIAYEVNNLFVTESSTNATVNDYTLPPGSQKYTGAAYGPSTYIPTARAAINRTKSRFGGFQNNSVQFQKADTKDELVYDLIVNEEIPPLLRVPPTYSHDRKEVTYILTDNENKGVLPTSATDLESIKNEGDFMLTTKTSSEELSTLQDSVIPEEVNNLAVTTSNTVEKFKGVGLNGLSSMINGEFSTTAIDESASGMPSTNEASETVSIFPSEFNNKHAEKAISHFDNVNEFHTDDGLKSKYAQGSNRVNGEEFLIVSGTSGIGASLNQPSTFQKTRANKHNELETKYNNAQTNVTHRLNEDQNNYTIHVDSSVLKTNEMSETVIDKNAMTNMAVINMTHSESHDGENMRKQAQVKSVRASSTGSNTEEELSSPSGLPHVEVTQDTPSQETVTMSWEDYDVTDKQVDGVDLRRTSSLPTMQRTDNDKMLLLSDDHQKIITHSHMANSSPEFTRGTTRNIQIDGTSRMSVNKFTSAAPQKMETTTKRQQKSNPDVEMTTKSPKVTISSRGLSFATTVDETRDILEQGRASLLQSSASASETADTGSGDSGRLTSGRKVQNLHPDSSMKDKEFVISASQGTTHDSKLKIIKDNLPSDYSTVTIDDRSDTHSFPVTPADVSEWGSTDSKTSGATESHNLKPTLQQKHFDDFSPVTMDPAALHLLTTLEAPVPHNQLHMKQKLVNNHLSRTGKQLNVLTHHIDETSSPLHHDEMTTELAPDFVSDTKPGTILENNEDPLLVKQLNDKNDILPSASKITGSRRNKTIMPMTYEEKEALNNLQEIFSLDTATTAKAAKLFMELNETSRHALMDMMKEAASNSTMRQLVVVMVNKSLSSMDFSTVRKHSFNSESNLPCDENMEPQIQQTSTEYNTQKDMANDRKHLRNDKRRQSLTTTEPPVTTYHSQDKKYQRFKSALMSTTSVFDLITSKNHTSFDEVPTSKPGVLDHSQLTSSVSEPEEIVSSEVDERVVELLRSLYSLAAQWG